MRVCAFAAVFVLAFSACLMHNLAEHNTHTIYFADSRNYLATATDFCTMYLDALRGKAPDKLMSDPAVQLRIATDGPIFATYLGSIFAVLGRPPQPDDWKILTAAQSFLHACTATLIALLVFRIVPSLRYAIPAGIAYALYPPALIAAGRLMTETLSNFLIVSFLSTIGLSFERPAWALCSGLVAGWSFINRVLLAPPVVTTIGLALACRKLKLTALALITVAFLSAIAPWFFFSWHYLGHPMITTERAGVHNAFNGWDVESDGFQTAWSDYKEAMLVCDNPISMMWGLIASDPKGCGILLVKKVSRLYGQPFNDFRHFCFGLDHNAILYIHWAYVLLGVMGIVLFAAGAWRRLNSDRLLASLLSLNFLTMMQAFFLFEANSRYGFTTIPLLTVFGTLAVYFLIESVKEKRLRFVCLGSALSVLIFLLMISSERLVSESKTESVCRLPGGQSLVCRIDLEGRTKKLMERGKFALLLVDGDAGLNEAQLNANGKDLGQPLISLNYLDSGRFRGFNLMRECAYGLGVSVQDLRQWRAAIIPIDCLKASGANTFTLTAPSQGTSVYINPDPSSRRYRSTRTISVNYLLNTNSGLESRHIEPVPSGVARKEFFLKNADGLKPLSGKSLSVYLAFPNLPRYALCQLSQPAGKPAVTNFTPNDFPLLTRIYGTNEIAVSKYVIAHSITGTSVKIPGNTKGTHLRVKFEGEVKGEADGSAAGIAITTAAGTQMPWMLPCLPFSIAAGRQWRKFELTDMVPFYIYDAPITQVAIGLYPGPWPEVSGVGPSLSRGRVSFRNLRLVAEPVTSVDLRGASLMLY